ncbi:hypothetical protein [Salmonella enterica]|uniref:hypothetical protein n=1 Tax=Salmonella enterica TaxID=28901 RepID=UPI0015E34333|nr:hypothetical protein [Salmonella enterica]
MSRFTTLAIFEMFDTVCSMYTNRSRFTSMTTKVILEMSSLVSLLILCLFWILMPADGKYAK